MKTKKRVATSTHKTNRLSKNTSIKKAATGLARCVSLSLGKKSSGDVRKFIKNNADSRRGADKRKRKEQQQRLEQPLVEKVALSVSGAAGALQAKHGGLNLTSLPPALASCLEAIFQSALPDLLVTHGKAGIGFPFTRVIQAIKDKNAPQSDILLRAVGLVKKRSEKETEPGKRKAGSGNNKKVRVDVHGKIPLEEGKKLGEQIRRLLGGLHLTTSSLVSGIDCPDDLVLAFEEWLQSIRSQSQKLANELEKLGISIFENGIENKVADSVLKKLFLIRVTPPEIIRDLLFSKVEWRQNNP